MTTYVKDTINALLSTNHKENTKAVRERVAREQKKVAFIKEYTDVKNKVIKPAMQEVVEQLKAKGLRCEIQENNDTEQRIARELNSIVIYFPLEDDTPRHSYDFPYIAFRANSHTESVNICENTSAPGRRGHATPVGDYKLDDINTNLVQNTVMNLLDAIKLKN